jgi:DNA-binding LacI/PurR family transcriptional regulator
LKSRLREGFILLRSSVGTQRIVENSGLPAVVHGQLHPSISRMAQIDRDQYQIGQILTDYLLRQRCSRMLVLLRETVSSGDHRFLDAVMSTCHDAGLGLDRLLIRCFPADSDTIAAGVRDVVTKRKTGVLCRNEQLAAAALAGVADSACSTNCVTAVADVYRSESHQFVSAATVVSPEEFGRQTGQILLQRLQQEAAEPARISIPVELRIPGELQ